MVLLLLVIFLFNQKSIAKVVKATGICKYIPGLPFCDQEDQGNDVNYEENEEAENLPDQTQNEDTDINVDVSVDNQEAAEQPQEETVEKEETSQEKPAPDINQNKKYRNSNLYFVNAHEDGSLSLEKIVRPIYFEDSPLTETLRSLLAGLNSAEMNDNLLTLIPGGSELKGVTIKNGIAFLDFNMAFTTNNIGREGYIYQLRQIIYTSTEFPTVDKVQFLINGKQKEYLSSEGIYIGGPLGRGDI